MRNRGQIADPSRRWRHALYVLGAVIVLRACTLVVPIFIHDEACIAVQAQTIVHGGHLYRDTADRKPPLVPYLYAAVFSLRGSADMIAVHVLAIVVVWLTTLLLWREAGLTAAWLYLLTSTSFLPIDVMGANFELFMLLPSTAAMCVAKRRDLVSTIAAGALIAIAALCKQTALVMLLPVALRVAGGGVLRVAAMMLGCAMTLAGAALLVGPHELFFWTIQGNGGYLAISGVLEHVLPRFVGMTAAFGGATLGLWWLVARSWPTRAQHLDWWVWLGANVLAVAAGLRFFGHYYLHLLPPACALAAAQLPRESARARKLILGFTILSAVVFATLGFWGRRIHNMPDYRPLADEVRRRTTPDQTIAIWGNYPEVLWAADRRSSVRFVHSNFLTGFSTGRAVGHETTEHATPGAWQMLFDDLAAHPPTLFIDTAPAHFRDYGNYPLDDFPALHEYVTKNFRPVTTVDGAVVYERPPR